MLNFFINLVIFIHVVGAFGSIVSCLSLIYKFNTVSHRRPVALIFISLVPFLNYYLMWEALKDYYSRATYDDWAWDNYKRRMGRVNNGKGVDFNG